MPAWRIARAGRWRLVLAAAALVAVAGWVSLWWWTAWRPRLALASSGANYPLAFSADGSRLATCSSVGITLFDPKDGRLVAEWPSPDGRKWANGKFSPDGRTFAAGWFKPKLPGQRGGLDLFDAASGQLRTTITPPLTTLLGYAFRDEGRTLRLIAADEASQVIAEVDVATGRVGPSRPLSGPIGWRRLMSFSADGRFLAMSDPSTKPPRMPTRVIVRDLDLDREVSVIPSPGPAGGLCAMDLSDDGKTLAIGGAGTTVEVWDVATARLLREWPVLASDYRHAVLWLSPDGSKLVSSGQYQRPAVSLDTLRFVFRRLSGDPNPLFYDLSIINLADGRRIGRSREEGLAVAFSPDGRSLATAHDDCQTRVHDWHAAH